MDAKLIALIEKFLQERRESDGGYAYVTGDDFDGLHEIIDKLIELKWQEDCDGDLPLEYILVNRNTHYGIHFRPVPYSHRIRELKGRDAIQAKLDWQAVITMNYGIAHDQMDQYLRNHQDDLREAKKRMPKAEPQEEHEHADKCPECGRFTVVSAGGSGVRCIADDCSYWFCY